MIVTDSHMTAMDSHMVHRGGNLIQLFHLSYDKQQTSVTLNSREVEKLEVGKA